MCETRLYGYFPPDINFQWKSDFTNGKMKRFHQHHQEEQFLNEPELFYLGEQFRHYPLFGPREPGELYHNHCYQVFPF